LQAQIHTAWFGASPATQGTAVSARRARLNRRRMMSIALAGGGPFAGLGLGRWLPAAHTMRRVPHPCRNRRPARQRTRRNAGGGTHCHAGRTFLPHDPRQRPTCARCRVRPFHRQRSKYHATRLRRLSGKDNSLDWTGPRGIIPGSSQRRGRGWAGLRREDATARQAHA